MKKQTLALTLMVFVTTFISANESAENDWIIFDCKDEFAYGIFYDKNKKKFISNNFQLENWTLGITNDLKKLKLSSTFEFNCSRYGSNVFPYLTCESDIANGMNVKFNLITNRYVYLQSSHSGYTDFGFSAEDIENTDSLHAGKCTKF